MSETVADRTQADYASVLIGTEHGLEEVTISQVAPDKTGLPTGVDGATEYAFLNAEQSAAFARQQFEVIRPNKDNPNYLGVFAVLFSGTSENPDGSTVLSLNTSRHQELIEKLARAGE